MEYSLQQRAFAEVLGTALLVLVGPGSVVATLVLAGDSKPAITGADLLGISFAFGGHPKEVVVVPPPPEVTARPRRR